MARSSEMDRSKPDLETAEICLCEWYVAKAKISMGMNTVGFAARDRVLQALTWAMNTHFSVSGWQHPATWGAMLCNLVMQQLHSTNTQLSQNLVSRLVRAQIEVLGPEHHQVMLSHQAQAHLLLEQQKFDEARKLVAMAYHYLMQPGSHSIGCHHVVVATALNLCAMRHSRKVCRHGHYQYCLAKDLHHAMESFTLQAVSCLMTVIQAVASSCNVQLFHICVHALADSMMELDQLEEVEALMLFVLQWHQRLANMTIARPSHAYTSAMTHGDLICWMVANFRSHACEPWQIVSTAYLNAQLFEQAIATASLVKPSLSRPYFKACITIAEASFQKGDLQARCTCHLYLDFDQFVVLHVV